nr:reverse transcriptase domain-containing protein [Tanacetum cinerariifolium]
CERVKDLLRQCPHHGFSELHQLDTFYNALNPNDQDAPDSAAGGNFLDKIPRECLSIIESKSKVRYSRSRVTDLRVSTNAPLLSSSSPSNSFNLQQIAASLEDKLDIRMNRFEKYWNDMKAFVTPTAPIKAVEEEKHEVKNVVEQPAERGNRIIQSLKKFRVIRKSSTFLKDTETLLSTTPETESDEVTESSAKNLLPIQSECEVTLEDKKITKADLDFKEEIRLIENLLYDNLSPRSPEELNAEIADMIIESLPSLPIPVQDG